MITFSGVVDVDPDISSIFIEYFNPEQKLTGSFTRDINPDGTFSFKQQANPDVFTIDGEYTFRMTYGNNVEKNFNYQKFRDIAPFVDQSKDPCSYVERYDNEPAYEEWFRDNYPEYISIYEAVGIQDKREICEPEMSEAEKQAREEIPNPCINIKEPQIDPKMQGDVGLNNPQYMEAVREAQYQYQQQIQHCLNEYQKQIDERIYQLPLNYAVDIEPLLDEGSALVIEKKYAEALMVFDQVLEMTDHKIVQGQVFFHKGTTYQSMKEYETALQYYDKALEIEPTHSPSISFLNLHRHFDHQQ